MKNVTVKLSLMHHRGHQQIKIKFLDGRYNRALMDPITGRKWSRTHGCWYLPHEQSSLDLLQKHFNCEGLADVSHFTIRKEKLIEPSIPLIEVDVDSNHRLKITILQHQNQVFEKLRNFRNSRFDTHQKCWLLPASEESLQQLEDAFPNQINFKIQIRRPDQGPTKIAKANKKIIPFNQVQQTAINDLERALILNRYSIHTKKSYLSQFKKFLAFYRDKDPGDITKEDIEQYLIFAIQKKLISESTQNQIINAIKFYYERILQQPRIRYTFTRPKKPLQLPNVLSKEEVRSLIAHTDNLKHKCILVVIYSAGLRLSEVTKLRVRDVNKGRRSLFIKSGKGKKDRYTVLAENVLPILNEYQKQYKPNYWLFEGQAGSSYSVRSVQAIFAKARDRAMINPFATVHTLRHSFATHCLEAGFSTAVIQEALGHASITTTERYLHISTKELNKLKSPLDDLDF